jgi:glutamate racemase
LQPLIRKELSDLVALIDPALPCAQTVRELLISMDLLNEQMDAPNYTFYVSDDPEKFQHLGKTFLNQPIKNISRVLI